MHQLGSPYQLQPPLSPTRHTTINYILFQFVVYVQRYVTLGGMIKLKGFGDMAEVIEPHQLREEFKKWH
jgi:hypothetical protein